MLVSEALGDFSRILLDLFVLLREQVVAVLVQLSDVIWKRKYPGSVIRISGQFWNLLTLIHDIWNIEVLIFQNMKLIWIKQLSYCTDKGSATTLTLISIQCFGCQKMNIETQCDVNVTENFSNVSMYVIVIFSNIVNIRKISSISNS